MLASSITTPSDNGRSNIDKICSVSPSTGRRTMTCRIPDVEAVVPGAVTVSAALNFTVAYLELERLPSQS
jgi:hypothetical protein